MTDNELLTARAETFGSIFVIVQHLARRADAELAEQGLTSRQWLLLAVLTRWFHGRSPSLSEAAERYGSSRQNVKQIALGLEARGFVRLVPDRSDGRTTRIELTERVSVFDEPEMVRQQAGMLADAFVGLSDGETLALRDLVRRWLGGVTGPRPTASAHP
jgi:DNA-binding MarR family transcriptional regulator